MRRIVVALIKGPLAVFGLVMILSVPAWADGYDSTTTTTSSVPDLTTTVPATTTTTLPTAVPDIAGYCLLDQAGTARALFDAAWLEGIGTWTVNGIPRPPFVFGATGLFGSNTWVAHPFPGFTLPGPGSGTFTIDDCGSTTTPDPTTTVPAGPTTTGSTPDPTEPSTPPATDLTIPPPDDIRAPEVANPTDDPTVDTLPFTGHGDGPGLGLAVGAVLAGGLLVWIGRRADG